MRNVCCRKSFFLAWVRYKIFKQTMVTPPSALDCTVKVKGLPFRATSNDIRKFFDEGGGELGNAIKEDGIRLCVGLLDGLIVTHCSNSIEAIPVASRTHTTLPATHSRACTQLPRSFVLHSHGRPTGMVSENRSQRGANKNVLLIHSRLHRIGGVGTTLWLGSNRGV